MEYLPRHAASELREQLATFRVVQVAGPRQSGKSTLARRASLVDRREISFDDDALRRRAQADPHGFLLGLGARPVLIDEAQRVPEIYLAIKRIVDGDPARGRFLLTGSSDPLTDRRIADSLAGRIGIVELRPMSQGEIHAAPETFLERIWSTDPGWGIASLDGVPGYLPRILAGGFPETLRFTPRQRTRWIAAYLDSVFSRDIRDIVDIADLGRLRVLFDLVASHSGQLVKHAAIARDASLAANTAKGWLEALEMTRTVDIVPAWSGGLRSRLVATPKAYVADSGLLAGAVGIDADGALASPLLLGALVETFVVQELLRQMTWQGPSRASRMYHYRDRDQREVDVVLERPDGTVVGIEVKAASRVHASDAAGIRALRSASGDRFHRGIVMYCGTVPLELEPGIDAIPIEALWSS